MKSSPDMHRVYVVEVARPKTSTLPIDPAKARGSLDWLCVGQYDDPDAARSHAQDISKHKPDGAVGVRVRQFWVQSFTPHHDADPRHDATVPAQVKLVDYQCPDHEDQKVRLYEGGTVPRCPICRVGLVPQSFADAMDSAMSLEDLTKGGK